jgi:hypothetical protein
VVVVVAGMRADRSRYNGGHARFMGILHWFEGYCEGVLLLIWQMSAVRAPGGKSPGVVPLRHGPHYERGRQLKRRF